MTMPAGTYYIGDLCYVMHAEWDEFMDLTFPPEQNGRPLDGEFTLKDGRRFACYTTAYGDGVYRDQVGLDYSVDAGLIGCILLTDIDQSIRDNSISGGNIVTFDKPFETSSLDGVISIGFVHIDTDPSDGWDEDEEDY